MIKKLKLELLYYFGILLVLSFLQHPDLFVSPVSRLELMQSSGNYEHPFIWSFVLYFFVGIFRAIFALITYIKNRNKTNE